MTTPSNYEKRPVVRIPGSDADCSFGWDRIASALAATGARVICVECYPGVFEDELASELGLRFPDASVYRSKDCLKSKSDVDAMLAPYLTDDPVFGRMNGIRIEHFFDPVRLHLARQALEGTRERALVIGTGAVLLTPEHDLLIYADMARWEIQARQRRDDISNFGTENRCERASLKYKRAFFVDWRAADRLKKEVFPTADFILDANGGEPKLVRADVVRGGLKHIATRPFRVVPFFDPGPWGGQWMRDVCDLPVEAPNYAWCFDCVPEENSILLEIGRSRIELPAIDVVLFEPRYLLGDPVHGRFGTEFPIRFDFLDTIDGGNLSLQVHPLTEYIQDRFGMAYTQDESYYILDAREDATVYLGLRDAIDPCAMISELQNAQSGGPAFAAGTYVNRWPARKHDHFSIPAGTVHCSGRNSMVLEISATPYIFTFKLWDWDRLGLDGRPRPIHLEHGRVNIQWDRTTDWVSRNLMRPPQPIAHGDGWCEERTGLHEREFIETRRHWFTGSAPHNTRGGVNVLNLVEGRGAVVESPDGAFEPFEVHYAETFIIPAAVGPYTIRPLIEARCATVKAFVRTNA
jgi:mannose-6-phosphate isomerase class I